MNNPIIVGHRGAKGLAPENTLKAFKIGCKFADFVECDIHLTKDGQLVVSHDASIERITGRAGSIKELTLEQLKKYDFGQGEKIPTLLEVLSLVRNEGSGLIIEIKGDSPEEALSVQDSLSDFFKINGVNSVEAVCSFWHETLIPVKKTNKGIKTFVIIEDGRTADEVIKSVDSSKADGAGIRADKITEECAQKLHKNGYFLNAWVVDEKPEFDKMVKIGADWITTNYPDRFLKK